jgi:3-deoxy-7-phosphoheptulonate synthase
MASGLSFPVGIKNGTGGSAQIAVNAMQAARSPHTFVGLDDHGQQASIRSRGNPFTQLILRGGPRPNYFKGAVNQAQAVLRQHQLHHRVIVDCSHANAEGDFRRQASVLDYVLRQRQQDTTYNVTGVMIESNLEEGSQSLTNLKSLRFGVSVTDGCVGWEETLRMLTAAYQRTSSLG